MNRKNPTNHASNQTLKSPIHDPKCKPAVKHTLARVLIKASPRQMRYHYKSAA